MTQPILTVNSIDRDTITQLYNVNEYPISDGVNICAVRSVTQVSNRFDDVICAFNKDTFMTVRGTTDPGLYYLNDPLSVDGCAIVPAGYHKDIWARGLHRGKYPALVQRGVIGVIRDYNKDDLVNYRIPYDATLMGTSNTTYEDFIKALVGSNAYPNQGVYNFIKDGVKFKFEVGLFGINLHTTKLDGDFDVVSNWSAGCQVVKKGSDFIKLRDFIYNDSKNMFSYALFNQDEYDNI